MINDIRKFYSSRNVLSEMVKRNVKNQYRNSVLGALWTLLNPLLYMIVLSFVFSNIFNRNGEIGCYPVYLLAGTIIFDLFRNSTCCGLVSIVDNNSLLTRVKIHQKIFPITSLLSNSVNFGFAFVALILVMLILRQPFYWTILLSILMIPALQMFILGISYFLAAMYVFFRDVQHIYSIFVTLWMYLTPIFYTTNVLPDNLQAILRFNPMYHYVTFFRDVVMYGQVPKLLDWVIIFGCGIVSICIGSLVFNASKKKFILYI
ncbi:MAG: ABC transporter permease [Clostridia bacterium]|nr:ABC transporter permease [Clostridia bacterium]